MFLFFARLTIVFLVSSKTCDSVCQEKTQANHVELSRSNCAVNSAHSLILSIGGRHQFSEVKLAFPVESRERDKAVSMLSLQTALLSLGYRSECVRFQDKLDGRVKTPCIALLDAAEGRIGHFVVLLEYDEETCILVDDSIAMHAKRNLTRTDFLNRWNGLAVTIMREKDNGTVGLSLLTWAVAFSVVIVILFFRSSLQVRKS